MLFVGFSQDFPGCRVFLLARWLKAGQFCLKAKPGFACLVFFSKT